MERPTESSGINSRYFGFGSSPKGFDKYLCFTHPSLCLDEIDKGLIPDVVIFDWEYGIESAKQSSEWLKEILNSSPKTFVFVYSDKRNEIPTFLNKQEFDAYSNRFQLFLKGDAKNSIFTTEEFILQYLTSRAGKVTQIKLSGLIIDFKENGFLKNTTDILFLERLFGRNNLIQSLKEKGTGISNETIAEMLGLFNERILFDNHNNLLIAPDSKMHIKKYNPASSLSYAEVATKYGLNALIHVIEVGIEKVNSWALYLNIL
ncbi:MAG: hypothetical protein IPP42_03030 [Saprospiraceae bacterium]|nr:hypothetical protein [Saprospiraceae bacterium]